MLRRGWLISPVLLFAAFLLPSCGIHLQMEGATPSIVKGTFDLFLYGCRHAGDVENVAVLVVKGGRYPFEIYSPETSFQVKTGLSAEQALAEANAFIRCGFHSAWATKLNRIDDGLGSAVGFELKPVYYSFELGSGDTLLTSYVLKNGKVRAYFRPVRGLDERGFLFDSLRKK